MSDSAAVAVAAIVDGARLEAQGAWRRLAGIAELVRLRCGDEEHPWWACDDWDAAAAEISAILGVTHGRASSEMHLALSLRDRLPRVGELLASGVLSYRACAAMVWRTDLIQDDAALALVDAALAEHARTWGPLSDLKLQRTIDEWVDRYDPGALRQTRSRARDRDVVVDLRNAHGGVLTGNRGIVPAPLLAELIRSGAKVRELRRPADTPEPQYRRSTALDEFVRMRDLTCRFPNCDVPAEHCDVDHTIAWPFGPTHASNLRCLCRKHHLLKTFWTGWTDTQHPDGTIVWTSPTGHTYRTQPGSRLFLPQWNVTTATLSPPKGQPPPTIGIMMPTRRQTRAAQRAHRITAERKLNDAHVTERNRPPPF